MIECRTAGKGARIDKNDIKHDKKESDKNQVQKIEREENGRNSSKNKHQGRKSEKGEYKELSISDLCVSSDTLMDRVVSYPPCYQVRQQPFELPSHLSPAL